MTCLDYENNITQTDALNRTTQWQYDNLGRVTKRILPLGQEETFTYDAVGNVLTKTYFNGQLIEFDYNVNNKLTRKDYPDGTFEAFTYTAIGR